MSARRNIYVWTLILVITTVLRGWTQQSDSDSVTQNPQRQQQSASNQQMSGMQMPNEQPQHEHGSMQGLDHKQMPGMQMDMKQVPKTFVEEIQHRGTSGTSAEPNSTPMPMLMTMNGKWMLMFHGEAFLNVLQQSGLRGSDKVFSTNWFMPMAQRQLGPGTFTVRTMLSFEPGTVTKRFYPELFQQGETAFGKQIVDGQHPHDFIMELAAL